MTRYSNGQPLGVGGGYPDPSDAGDYLRGDRTWADLNKAAVGLSNVDNTSDANKPISSATQSALDGKVTGAGGNASATVVTATGRSTARALSARFADVWALEDEGATGDGATNDRVAMQAVLDAAEAAGGGVVYAGAGNTYKISGDLRIPQSVRLDLRGATIAFTNTTDSIIMEAGAFILNGTISAVGITGYVGPAILVDDSDGYSRLTGELFGLESVRILGPGQGASAAGTGIKLHGTSAGAGNGITRGRFREVYIANFSKGVHLHSETSWVNNNWFQSIEFFGCVDFVYLQRGADDAGGNTFDGLTIQPNTSTAIASRAVYCGGRYNVFRGHIWDWGVSGSSIAVEFTADSSQNTFECMIDPQYVRDYATGDHEASFIRVWSGNRYPGNLTLPPATVETTSFTGSDDMAAYVDQFGTVSLTGDAVASGALANIFRPNGAIAGWTSLSSAVIKIDFGSAQSYICGIGVVFAFDLYAESVTIETSTDDITYTARRTVTGNLGCHVGVWGGSFIAASVRYIRITVANSPARATQIVRAYVYGANNPGSMYVSRGGGRVEGNLQVRGYLSVTDGMTAPGAGTGEARIYVDTADGDLKVVFADGTIKTIVVDT